MMQRIAVLRFLLFISAVCSGQDSTVVCKNQSFHLSEVVVRNNFNISAFIEYMKNDTTFYKAFRNLHLLSFTSLNHIEMLDKKGRVEASLDSKTRQNYAGGCRTM